MKFPVLTRENVLMYAVKAYAQPLAKSMEDFRRDMKVFSYVGKFLNKLDKPDAEPVWRLLVNHVVGLLNIFRSVAATRLLLFYFDRAEHRAVLLAVLDGLGQTPPPSKVGEVDILEVKRDQRAEAYMRSISRGAIR